MSWSCCNGKCKHFEGYRKSCKNSYKMGLARCNTCCVFFIADRSTIRCGCCTSRLRHPKKEISRVS